jgi:hypothetical protein
MKEQQDLGLLTQKLAPRYDEKTRILEAKININRICDKYDFEIPFKDIEAPQEESKGIVEHLLRKLPNNGYAVITLQLSTATSGIVGMATQSYWPLLIGAIPTLVYACKVGCNYMDESVVSIEPQT